jgi:hypothetical protein
MIETSDTGMEEVHSCSTLYSLVSTAVSVICVSRSLKMGSFQLFSAGR